MALLTLTRRKWTRIGLDIGEDGVRAVQLLHRPGGYDVSTAVRGERSPGGAGAIEADPAKLGRRIRNVISGAEFRGRIAVTALSVPDVEFHLLDLPQAVLARPAREVDSAVRFEVGRLMGESTDALETRFWTLQSGSKAAPNAMAVAVKRNIVLNMMSVCSSGGLTCGCVDTIGSALSRLGSQLCQWSPRAVWGILDVGARQCRLVMCMDNVPILVRGAGSGGDDWTRRIADSLQVSLKAAEIHKKEHGIALTGRGIRQGESAPSHGLPSILSNALRTDLTELAGEIKRSYEYVLSCHPSREAGDLVLVGGGAAMHNLSEYLSQALGIPVRRASSYLTGESCRLSYDEGRGGPLEVFALAIGLAIGV